MPAQRPTFLQQALLLVAALAAGCGGGSPAADFGGTTMGTTWSLTLVAVPDGIDATAVAADVGALVDRLDAELSTWRPESPLSRFNDSTSTDWRPTATAVCRVVDESLAISRQTGGAFDVTIGPLVNLWGFGPSNPIVEPPPAERIAGLLAHTGYARLAADCERPALRKSDGAVYVDLSAIAKGYAVDRAAELLESRGIRDYMVEVGGEIRVRGNNPDGGPWRIAIERPAPGGRLAEAVMTLTDRAVATSGDYRNFFEYGGRRYSHTIDPRTGYPVSHAAASVTIIADTATRADALATALLVLGPEDGLALAERIGSAACFLVHGDGDYELRASSAFTRAGYLE